MSLVVLRALGDASSQVILMEVHQLRYLEAVASAGSMMAAAAACHISQPGLSVQIKKLEDELGVKLLARQARGVTLTPEGERALFSARMVLAELTRLKSDVRQVSLGRKPVLRIAVQPLVASDLLIAPIIATIAETVESWRVEFRERASARLVEAVASGAADVGLVDLATVRTDLVAKEELLRIPYALFCREDDPLARRKQLKLMHLLTTPVMLFEGGLDIEGRLLELASEGGGRPDFPYSTELAVTAIELVAAGAGVAVLPVNLLPRARRRRLVARRIVDCCEYMRIGGIWRPDRPPSTLARAVFDRLRMSANDWDNDIK